MAEWQGEHKVIDAPLLVVNQRHKEERGQRTFFQPQETKMRDGYSILPPRYSDYCNDGNDYDPSDAMQYQAEMALWRFRASKLKLALFDALGDKSCQN